MTAAVSGIWNPLSTMNHPVAPKSAETASGSDGSDTGSSSISANDFLTLLVTEMKNQDPTANTDPNEYINQLVQVNSLQQLISINQTLTADSAGVENGNAVTKSHTQPRGMNSAVPPNFLQADSANHLPDRASTGRVSGNLTIPATSSAAIRVAQSLESK